MKRIVRDLMIHKFVSVNEKDPIYEVMEKLAKEREAMIACVVDEENRLIGLISPKELLRTVEVHEFGTIKHPRFEGPEVLHLLTSRYARDIMCAPISVAEDDEIQKAISIMVDEGFYELPVVDEEKRVIGQVNYFGIIASSIEHLKRK